MQWLKRLIPPREWQLPVVFLLGVIVGLGCLVVYISNAFSYLSDEPQACINCHVMASEYATWQRGSHGRVTVCNDCHVPHDNIVKKYVFKAKDGLRHATYFTMRWEPQVMMMQDAGIEVVQQNCLRCHGNLLDEVSAGTVDGANPHANEGLLCWQCHRQTPHGRVHSLASTPYARIPGLSPVVPQWMRELKTRE